MRVRKQKFPCEHVGFGKYCHRCAEAERFLKMSKTKPGSRRRKMFISRKKRRTSWLVNVSVEKLVEIAKHLKEDGKSCSWRPSTHPKIILP